MQRGWSMKQMIRLIVTSATYRQSSQRAARAGSDAIPDNTLLARQSRLRLPAELIRDAALDASGLLDLAHRRPSVRPPQPTGVAELSYADSREVGGEHRAGPLPPRPLHPLPAHRALSAADELRRAELPTSPARGASAPTRRCRRSTC